jgi:protein TonB
MSERDAPPKEPLRIWFLAVCGSVALHAFCVSLVALNLHDAPDEVAFGAPAIEIDIELAAPRVQPNDLPPGPNVEASAATPTVTAQKEVVSELPKAAPAETADPDAVVAPVDTKKPKKDSSDIATTQATAAEASVAAVATAVPRPETAADSVRSVAPAQGTGESVQRVRATWQKELAAHFDRYKRYPSDRSQLSAELIVSFELDRTGHVLSTHIVQGSGDVSFDEAGLAMMRRADPVPAPPAPVADEGLTFTMPIIFRVKGRS